MDKENDRRDEALIDLGSVEAETRGVDGFIDDTGGLRQLAMGLSDD